MGIYNNKYELVHDYKGVKWKVNYDLIQVHMFLIRMRVINEEYFNTLIKLDNFEEVEICHLKLRRIK